MEYVAVSVTKRSQSEGVKPNTTASVPSWSYSKAVYKPVWHTPLLSVQWINCWWWTEELSEKFRVSCQNKFVKLVHLIGFIIKKFVTMQHGHMNVKFADVQINFSFATTRELHKVTTCRSIRLHVIFDVFSMRGSPFVQISRQVSWYCWPWGQGMVGLMCLEDSHFLQAFVHRTGSSAQQLHFVRQCLMLVGPQHGTGFMSASWRLYELWGAS